MLTMRRNSLAVQEHDLSLQDLTELIAEMVGDEATYAASIHLAIRRRVEGAPTHGPQDAHQGSGRGQVVGTRHLRRQRLPIRAARPLRDRPFHAVEHPTTAHDAALVRGGQTASAGSSVLRSLQGHHWQRADQRQLHRRGRPLPGALRTLPRRADARGGRNGLAYFEYALVLHAPYHYRHDATYCMLVAVLGHAIDWLPTSSPTRMLTSRCLLNLLYSELGAAIVAHLQEHVPSGHVNDIVALRNAEKVYTTSYHVVLEGIGGTPTCAAPVLRRPRPPTITSTPLFLSLPSASTTFPTSATS
ncbi:hypothetical protein SPRG_19870 [Saprolegnia parasitica CBS 223.65]|uniref:Uncharacterized protein n=1 Tax=Saprolegnia parasitica (strain CBS 223.65) TaxID=695850 RepID=A0A067CJ65_SAPPC|nr:hypothetical protein SPRG_19870 [Saprolegnia parasitica CBS 223.65]KDO29195.1 hypothetical protein SPRG_19870 [Saprolegnia parasitica CBS 223.65]|eukprot:XP_012200097.1 hypothetical protein SPRG_19870 [Saprolegnia parasitica CBS 223.65]